MPGNGRIGEQEMAENTFVGNIGGDPEMKFTPNGKAVLNFSIAENHSKPDGQGGFVEDGTTWRRVSVWGWLGEALAESLKSGDRVIVVGAERLREFTTNEGAQGKSLEVTAKYVGRMPKKSEFEQRNGGGQQGYQQGGYVAGPQQGQQNPGQMQGGGWGQNPNQQGGNVQSNYQPPQGNGHNPAQQGAFDPWAQSNAQPQFNNGPNDQPPF